MEEKAISEFHARILKQKKDNELLKKELIDDLQRAVPANLKYAIFGMGIIEEVVNKGIGDRKIEACDGAHYGFKDWKEFVSRFDGLKQAWAGVITVSLQWNHDESFYLICEATS
jgi:hypothetical protein